uniref:Matrin-type domain-containing protein n=1 Tax=Sciurus vulgaris TaxID=55149 RepID=A0A8D2DVH2_SCIVU
MHKFYCNYCDIFLTHDAPSVRKTHSSGRKHKENMKDSYQKWIKKLAKMMEEQVQSLINKATAAFQLGRVLLVPSLYLLWQMHPTSRQSSSAWYDASIPHGRPSYDVSDGPSSSWDDACGICFWNEGTHRRPHASNTCPPMMTPPARPMMASTWPGMMIRQP